MLLLTNCEVHTGKYLDRSFELRTERSDIFHVDRTDWSIRALLYSQYFVCLRKPQFCVQVHTALDGPRINQSNHEFLSCYTINSEYII